MPMLLDKVIEPTILILILIGLALALTFYNIGLYIGTDSTGNIIYILGSYSIIGNIWHVGVEY